MFVWEVVRIFKRICLVDFGAVLCSPQGMFSFNWIADDSDCTQTFFCALEERGLISQLAAFIFFFMLILLFPICGLTYFLKSFKSAVHLHELILQNCEWGSNFCELHIYAY